MSNTYNILILGSGMVGKATGIGLQSLGQNISFIDYNIQTLKKLQAYGTTASSLKSLSKKIIISANILYICLPTPTNNRGVDTSILFESINDIIYYLQNTTSEYPIVTIRSTIPIGTTHKIISKLEKLSGKKHTKDFGVCFNPEYLREVSASKDFMEPRIVILGVEDSRTARIMSSVYSNFSTKIHILNIREAETHKYVHNIYNATKISFFNEMRSICEHFDIHADTIFPLVVKSAEASWNPQYGIKNLGPFSGSCLPKDTMGFLHFAHKHKIPTPLLESVILVNNNTQKHYTSLQKNVSSNEGTTQDPLQKDNSIT